MTLSLYHGCILLEIKPTAAAAAAVAAAAATATATATTTTTTTDDMTTTKQRTISQGIFYGWMRQEKSKSSGVGVRLFASHSYLTDVTATELRRHLSNIYIIIVIFNS